MAKLYDTEAQMCAQFTAMVTAKGWVVYPETAGFDMLVVSKKTGTQIGIEAKLALNTKVLAQAAESARTYQADWPGPDFRAVLVPREFKASHSELVSLALALGITILRIEPPAKHGPKHGYLDPGMPHETEGRSWEQDHWFPRFPAKRCPLPEVVPDCAAGASAPTQLTPWKIAAIKLVIVLEKRGYLVRKDFKDLSVSPSRWLDGQYGYLNRGAEGWVAGPNLPDFRAQHPRNFPELEALWPDWSKAITTPVGGEQ